MARSLWSGAISFGLVNVPVKLVSATQDHDIHFHQIDRKTQSRVRYKVVASGSDDEVPRENIVKGYEIGPDQYVTVKPEELDSLMPEKSRSIDISDFVDLDDIDPVYYDRPYYLLPEETAAKAYRLLVKAMDKSRKVGIARFVMRNKEYLVAIRATQGVLCAEIMRFADEVILPDQLQGVPSGDKVNEKELAVARQLIEALAGKFEPGKYRDDYRQRVEELIHKKAEGSEITVASPVAEPRRVIDLMAALKASLEEARRAHGGHRNEPLIRGRHATGAGHPHPHRRRRKSA